MSVTIDTSALLAVLLDESHKPELVRLTQQEDLIAPQSLDAELGNAVSTMLKRSRISLADSKEVMKLFEQIPVRRTSIRLSEAIQISDKLNIYAFEAYFLDCCLQYQSPLLTLDEKQKKHARTIGISILEPGK